jgi:uncharacterized iron-regulated membrane protein
MKEKIAIVISAVVLLVLTGVAVHKTDKWYYERRQAAQAAAAKHDAELAAQAQQAKQKAHDAAVVKYNACVASQASYDKQTVALKAKSVRPVCTPVTN